MSAISAVLKSLAALLVTFFQGTERYVNAYAKGGEWAEEATQGFVDKARSERELDLEDFAQQLAERKAKRLPKPKAVA